MMLAMLALSVLLVAPAHAAPIPCLSGSGTTALSIQIGQGDCEFNGFLFNFQSSSTTNAAQPGSTNAIVNANTNVLLTSLGALGVRVEFYANSPSKSFAVLAATVGTFNYHYDITPLSAMDLIAETYNVTNAFSTSPGWSLGSNRRNK